MNRSRFLVTALSLLPFLFLPLESRGATGATACYGCRVDGDHYKCGNSTDGGTSCSVSGSGASARCTLKGRCGSTASSISFARSFIEELAHVHPGLALSIGFIANEGDLILPARVHRLDYKLSSENVTALLAGEQLDLDLNSDGEVIYELQLQDGPSGEEIVVTPIQESTFDPPFSKLVIQVRKDQETPLWFLD